MSMVSEEQIEGYLGNSRIDEFSSKKEIRKYFSKTNLIMMFGRDNDFSDSKNVMNRVLEIWGESKISCFSEETDNPPPQGEKSEEQNGNEMED